MPPDIRAIIAATAHAFVRGTKVAGIYDHHGERHLRIAAETRGRRLQGYDGDRDARFGGTLPEIRDARSGARVHVVIDGATATAYDRASSGHASMTVSEGFVQVFDHSEGHWFAYGVNVN